MVEREGEGGHKVDESQLVEMERHRLGKVEREKKTESNTRGVADWPST